MEFERVRHVVQQDSVRQGTRPRWHIRVIAGTGFARNTSNGWNQVRHAIMSQIDQGSDSNELSGSGNGNLAGGVLATIDSQLPQVPAVGWSYGPPQRPEILSARPNPTELAHAVRRRWPLAIGAGLSVGTIAMVLVWYVVPVRYEAFALLQVAERPGGVLSKTSEDATAFDIFKRTQIQMILSGRVSAPRHGIPRCFAWLRCRSTVTIRFHGSRMKC